MTYVLEARIIDVWLTGVLKADPTLTGLVAQRVYVDEAPDSATSPMIVFSDQANADVTALGGVRVMNDSERLIRVLGEGHRGYDALDPIAARVEVVLGNVRNVEVSAGIPAAPIGMIEACYRRSIYRRAYADNGVRYREVGGFYRILARSY